MCTARAGIAATASPQALWQLFEDVAGWTALDALPNAGPIGETVLAGERFLVSHALESLPSGRTRVSYAIRVEGREETTPGALVTAGLAEMLAALRALAGHGGAGES